jgi:hypothetical protein
MLRVTNGGGPEAVNERNAIGRSAAEEILFSNTDPVSKVQQIIKLGFDPEVADEIVERHQVGTARAPVYYERLDFADLDDEPTLEERRAQSKSQNHQVRDARRNEEKTKTGANNGV